MHKKVIDFKTGERIEDCYIIKMLNVKTSTNNKKYLDLRIADDTGDVEAKFWNIEDGDENKYSVGDIIKLKADITLWMDRIQVKILNMRIANKDEFDFNDIVPSAPIDAQEMYDFIRNEIDIMTNEDIKKITKYLVDKRKKEFMYYPAAKSNHHSIRAGLLYHVYRMIKVGKELVKIYGANSDLLVSGIILHDLEKINEMYSKEIGLVEKYTVEGEMLGHITQGVVEIEKAGKILGTDPEIVLLLKHMVLSHHYEAEYGSPKKPVFLEAELLHYVDVIDARVFDFQKAMRSCEKGTFSDPVFSLEKRRVYNPNIK